MRIEGFVFSGPVCRETLGDVRTADMRPFARTSWLVPVSGELSDEVRVKYPASEQPFPLFARLHASLLAFAVEAANGSPFAYVERHTVGDEQHFIAAAWHGHTALVTPTRDGAAALAAIGIDEDPF